MGKLIGTFTLVLMALGLLGSSSAAGHSQPGDATPTPATGITTEVLGQGQPSDVPGMMLWLLRITFEPGAVAASHSHPGSSVFTIQSGSITFMLEEGTVTLHRAGTIATPAAAEEISAGTEFTLNAGDTVFYESDAVFSEVNEGDEPAVILVANLRGEEEPARVPAATPAA
ncbi:MAG TPA: cupin domain-containing protein [Thermomicrobiales bacterium]|nr:cupin domain-containing protein [Thermomicrobiales bacterium]